MRVIAISMKTEPLEDLDPGQTSLLEELLRDKRLTKAESIKAYRESDKYLKKKDRLQRSQAEFGRIKEVSIATHSIDSTHAGEEAAISALADAVNGADIIVGFDLHQQLSFVLRRHMLTGVKMSLKLSGKELVDLKQAWGRSDRAYSDLTLEQLLTFTGDSDDQQPKTSGEEAVAVFELYEKMKGNLL